MFNCGYHMVNYKHCHQFLFLVMGQGVHREESTPTLCSTIFSLLFPMQWKKSLDTIPSFRIATQTKHKDMHLDSLKSYSKPPCLNFPLMLLIPILNCSSTIQSLHTNLINQHTKLNNKPITLEGSSKKSHPLG